MSDSTPRSADADLGWCYDIVDDVSRTFALTIAELDEPLSSEICIGYLLCRVADTIEDAEHIPASTQSELLALYHGVLDPGDVVTVSRFMESVEEWFPSTRSADWQVVAETPRVIATFQELPVASREEIRPPIQEMVDGMIEFIDRYAEDGGLRVQTLDELEEYCWYAAGTVGCLVTGLVTRDASPDLRDRLYETADSFGLLLQLVNVAKDVTVDYEEENNVYVPVDLLQAHGLTPGDIGDEDLSEEFEPVITTVVEEAEAHVEGARTWLGEMPTQRGNTLSAWAVPFLLAVGTMRELRDRPADVITDGDVQVSRDEVFALLEVFSGSTDPSVKDLEKRVRQGTLGQ